MIKAAPREITDYQLDSHRSIVIPRELGPYSGKNFEPLVAAFNQLSKNGTQVDPSYLKNAVTSGNFKLIPIPLQGDDFIVTEIEDLKSAFRIKEVESLVRSLTKDDKLSLERASLQLNILTKGNESYRHEHRIKDGKKWAFITMVHRSAKGSIFWTEEPTISPNTPGKILSRDLKPGDSILFDASIYHGSTLTEGKGMVARAAWGFS